MLAQPRRRIVIGYFLRHSGNFHYFAAIKPYLDHYLGREGCDNHCPTWRKGGISSIERFLDGDSTVASLAERYNLIVKPHPNIFNPDRPHFDQSIVDRLERVPGIVLVRSGNVMPWLAQADLFIGDISAAGYEWLYFNRPMVFLNPRPGDLQASYDAQALTYLWQCGAVCDDMRQLVATVGAALTDDPYMAARDAVLHYSVHQPHGRGALERGIAAIEALLAEDGGCRPKDTSLILPRMVPVLWTWRGGTTTR